MEENMIKKVQEETAGKKKVYIPPKLDVYGKLTELTGSGLGSLTESKPHPTGTPNKP